jgi:adenosine kinase
VGENTVLASPDHEGIIEDVTEAFEIDYSPGGSTQNTLRYVTWVIGADIATYAGHVSDDYFGRMLQACVKKDGLRTIFTIKKNAPTGTCLCLVSEDRKNRSLIASLGAAGKFTKDDLLLNWFFAEQASVYFLSGHALAVSPESVMLLAHEVTRDQFNRKKMVFNIGAPYVCERYSMELKDVFPYVDLAFMNENQARAFAKMQGYEVRSQRLLFEVTKHMLSCQ